MTHTPWGEIGDFCSDTNTYHVGKFRRWMYYVFNTRSTHGKMLYAPSGDAEYSPRASERYLGNLCLKKIASEYHFSNQTSLRD